jgi:hypothetical protein
METGWKRKTNWDFLCLVNLDKFIRTMCFSVNSIFICCNVLQCVLFICCGGYVIACFRCMFFLEFAQSLDYDFFNIFYDLFLCSFGILLPMFQKKTTNKQTCQWTLTLTWLVGFQTNKRPLFYLPNTWDIWSVQSGLYHISSKRIICP